MRLAWSANQRAIAASAAGMAICVTVFVASLLYQFGLLEGVSCIAAWGQLFFLCVTATDAFEDRQTKSPYAVAISLALTIVVAAWLGADLLLARRLPTT